MENPYGISMGSNPTRDPMRDLYGRPRHARTGPAQILLRARSNLVIGPVRDLAGHSGHARSNPVRAPAGAAIWDAPPPHREEKSYTAPHNFIPERSLRVHFFRVYYGRSILPVSQTVL